MKHARDEYRLAKENIGKSTLSMDEKLDAGRDALRERRRSITAIYRDLKPQSFGEWLREWEQVRERERCRTRATGQDQRREQPLEHSRGPHAGSFSKAERTTRQPFEPEIER